MDGLPFLPGYCFRDQTKTKFHRAQSFKVHNGYRLPLVKCCASGSTPLDVESTAYYSPADVVRYDPSLTYGRVKNHGPDQVLPHWQLYDKKALTFNAFFKQAVVESADEHYRVRHVNIIYFLEDDTITVMEPEVENSGIPQGRLIRRGKIPKHTIGNCWHWKDLNVGIDVAMYGFVLHTVDCDLFTREFLESQGVELNPTEDLPPDPYIMERKIRIHPSLHKTPPADDQLRRFLEYDGKILRFWAVWDDRDADFGDMRPYVVYYHLATDCVEVQEIHTLNDGRDPFPLLVKKMKLPRNWKDVPINFPTMYLEKTEDEVSAYYTPSDFRVGQTIFVLGRRFLLYDCDPFTRNYYKRVLNITQAEPLDVFPQRPPGPVLPHPPHNTFGSPEDSLQNCLTLHPKAPKKDFVRYCCNANKYLRYGAEFDAVHPEDFGRKFVINYHLADGTIKIVEPPIRNSGFIGGTFLQANNVAKPGSNPDNPDFYTPADFYVGAVVTIYGQRFVINDVDLHVYRYMQDNPEKFTQEVMVNVKNHMAKKGLLSEDIGDRACEIQEENKKKAEEDCDNIPLEKLVLKY